MPGSKHIYLGLYESEDQAAKVCILHTLAADACRLSRCPPCLSTFCSIRLASCLPSHLPLSMYAPERAVAVLHDMPGLGARVLLAGI